MNLKTMNSKIVIRVMIPLLRLLVLNTITSAMPLKMGREDMIRFALSLMKSLFPIHPITTVTGSGLAEGVQRLGIEPQCGILESPLTP
jgi:hypothetical protein